MSNYEKWMLLLVGIVVMILDSVFIVQETWLWIASISCIMVALKLMWEGRK